MTPRLRLMKEAKRKAGILLLAIQNKARALTQDIVELELYALLAQEV